MSRVIVLGSSNTDMTVRLPQLPTPGQTVLGGSFATGPGGKGANQAVAARRAGADVIFVTAVGDDALGRQALDLYQSEGIDISQARIVAGVRSGVALIFVGERGENMIGVASGANARLDPDAVDRLPDSVFRAGDVLLAGLEIPSETAARAIRRARAAGMRVVLNPAPANLAILEENILADVDVLTPNAVELRALSGNAADVTEGAAALLSRGAGAVVVTLGERGSLVAEHGVNGPIFRPIRAFSMEAVDTVGAGDAFNGALAASIAEGRALFEAAVWATAAAGLAVTRPGAQSASPRRDEIDRLAATYPPG
jgi:ribokinase